MPNQRLNSPKARDGRPAFHLRPGDAVEDFPATGTAVVTSSSGALEDGAVLVFSTVDFYLELDGGDATTSDMRYPGSQLVTVAIKSGDVVSILPTASGTVHAHYAD